MKKQQQLKYRLFVFYTTTITYCIIVSVQYNICPVLVFCSLDMQIKLLSFMLIAYSICSFIWKYQAFFTEMIEAENQDVYKYSDALVVFVLLFLNYCCNAAWYGGDQAVALLGCYWNPGCFNSNLQLVCIVWSDFFIFLLKIPSCQWVCQENLFKDIGWGLQGVSVSALSILRKWVTAFLKPLS